MSERKISCQIPKRRRPRVASVPLDPLSESKSRQLELTGSVKPDGRGRVGTIRILVESVDRRGRSSASLPDGTVLVGSSRQPFLDAARVLIASGYVSWLESWRPAGSGPFPSRKFAHEVWVKRTRHRELCVRQ
jgi:hypothetical protein